MMCGTAQDLWGEPLTTKKYKNRIILAPSAIYMPASRCRYSCNPKSKNENCTQRTPESTTALKPDRGPGGAQIDIAILPPPDLREMRRGGEVDPTRAIIGRKNKDHAS